MNNGQFCSANPSGLGNVREKYTNHPKANNGIHQLQYFIFGEASLTDASE